MYVCVCVCVYVCVGGGHSTSRLDMFFYKHEYHTFVYYVEVSIYSKICQILVTKFGGMLRTGHSILVYVYLHFIN